MTCDAIWAVVNRNGRISNTTVLPDIDGAREAARLDKWLERYRNSPSDRLVRFVPADDERPIRWVDGEWRIAT